MYYCFSGFRPTCSYSLHIPWYSDGEKQRIKYFLPFSRGAQSFFSVAGVRSVAAAVRGTASAATFTSILQSSVYRSILPKHISVPSGNSASYFCIRCGTVIACCIWSFHFFLPGCVFPSTTSCTSAINCSLSVSCYNNSLRKHLSPAISCAYLFIFDEQYAPKKQDFNEQMGQCLADRCFIIFWLWFRYRLGHRLKHLLNPEKMHK